MIGIALLLLPTTVFAIVVIIADFVLGDKEPETQEEEMAASPDDVDRVAPPGESDPINPQHYKGKNGLEVVDLIEAFGLDSDHYLASALAYICRAGKKGGNSPAQDLKKAIWFLQRRIQRFDEQEQKS